MLRRSARASQNLAQAYTQRLFSLSTRLELCHRICRARRVGRISLNLSGETLIPEGTCQKPQAAACTVAFDKLIFVKGVRPAEIGTMSTFGIYHHLQTRSDKMTQ